MKTLLCLSLCLLTGCAGFSGKRSVEFEMTILGRNSIKWTSTCDGAYPETEEEECK